MITDLSYVQAVHVGGDNVDMGIDAVCIRDKTVYLFNFKYSLKYMPNNNFPSDEANKILRYCKNSWLYILYFFRLAYEKYELNGAN